MKTIREIVTDLNVARSNDCSKEKSEEIKKIINDLLPHELYEKACKLLDNYSIDIVEIKADFNFYYGNDEAGLEDYNKHAAKHGYEELSMSEYLTLQGVFGYEPK